MSMIFCHKLQKQGEQLPRKPIAGELGDRIYQHICQEAWQAWVARQTMLINEYRLDSTDRTAQQFIRQEMEKFLFENE